MACGLARGVRQAKPGQAKAAYHLFPLLTSILSALPALVLISIRYESCMCGVWSCIVVAVSKFRHPISSAPDSVSIHGHRLAF
jgi:hypothetical protein